MTADKTPDEMLAGNIAAARARRKLQQSNLAARMTALGYKWVRQTVGEIENGNRRVTAAELYGLAIALEIPVTLLVVPWADEGSPTVRLPSGLVLEFSVQFRAHNVPASAVLWEGDVPRFDDTATLQTIESA
jgi:transcriptional regulator with XRE-family HTH domain